jgi:hypothetical protein
MPDRLEKDEKNIIIATGNRQPATRNDDDDDRLGRRIVSQ